MKAIDISIMRVKFSFPVIGVGWPRFWQLRKVQKFNGKQRNWHSN